MSENKERYIIIDGEKVYVSEEVYREYYRPVWREVKRERVRMKIECSLEMMENSGVEFADDSASTDETVVDKLMIEKLHMVLDELSEDERFMVDFLYFQGKSERDLAALSGTAQSTISYRKIRLINKLRKKLKEI